MEWDALFVFRLYMGAARRVYFTFFRAGERESAAILLEGRRMLNGFSVIYFGIMSI